LHKEAYFVVGFFAALALLTWLWTVWLRRVVQRRTEELQKHQNHLDQLVAERTRAYERANAELEREIEERRRAQRELAAHQDRLEAMVDERTADLIRANRELRKECEQRRRVEESHQHLSAGIEQAVETVLIMDAQGRIQYVNPAFESTSGYRRDEVLGKNLDILLDTDNADDELREMWETVRAGDVWSGERTHRRKDGKAYREEVTLCPVRNPRGEIISFVSVQHDITEKLLLRDQLRQAQKMEAVGNLAGGVAHDFNNLLMVIVNSARFIKESVKGRPQVEEDVDDIIEASRSAVDLTRQLLAFSRRQPLLPKVCDLNKILADTETMMRRTIGEDIELIIHRSGTPVPVEVDPGQIKQVILNLAVNARAAMPDGGELRLELSEVGLTAEDRWRFVEAPEFSAGTYALLTVSDSGVGMDAETLSHVFEPFFTTKAAGKGTGLGLSTVYGIVRQHTGLIAVRSEPGIGTVFEICLPVSSAPEVAEAGAAPEGGVVRGDETILFVEDELVVRRVGCRMLRRLGYRVLEASSGEEAMALEATFDEPIHLLLTDVIMPGIDGGTLAERMRGKRPGIKVLFASGYSGTYLDRHGKVGQDDPLLAKPFLISEVSQMLRRLLDG